MATLRPPRGHVYLMPDGDSITHGDGLLVRHPDWMPVSQLATVIAVGAPLPVAVRSTRGYRHRVERCEVSAGDRVLFPWKHKGHEIGVGGQTLRSLTYEQIKDCLLIEEESPDVR